MRGRPPTVRSRKKNLLYEASCLVVEKGMAVRREDPGGRVKAGDVVVGRLHAVAGVDQ